MSGSSFTRRKLVSGIPSVGLGLALGACFAPVRASIFSADPDVIVVGAGGAGLAAALAAAEAGASVLVLEKQSEIGGNTRVSGGYFACVDPKRQSRMGIEDSEDLFLTQLIASGGSAADPELCRVLVANAGKTLLWLESHGMRFQDTVIELYGSHWPRVHKPLMPMGEGYIHTLSGAAIRRGVRIRTKTPVTKLIVREGRVAGVVAGSDGEEIFAKRGVILASGGFGANRRMVAEVAPQLAGLTTSNQPGSTGEMLLAAKEAGAVLVGMPYIQCLPGCPPGRTHRVRLHNDVSRFILVNAQGKRFIREDGRRDVLRDAVLALPERYAYSIVDDEGLRSYNIVFQKETVIGIETGDAWRGDSIAELATAMGLPPEALERTVERYNEGVRQGHDEVDKAPAVLRYELKTPPFWACYVGMTVHYTMGGMRISPRAEVLRADGSPIPGLYAAGEATGGVHGVNRMGANGINDAVVFGRIAGTSAAGNGP
ncbi:flavocytochrome c [Sutterella sp.]|uniref:FAD-dependent oxidoreductase n=1 Tax=Sutterella sp. TaxID=1981025 RepID=UPI0026DF7F51|nr:flavocytochrome c [Sutterella sp.]MDO5532379.1 flavocytochrome c [Sutterella sp.]